MIGRLHHIVIDCPDPTALASFYADLLSWNITYNDGEWVVVAAHGESSGIACQLTPDFQPPLWPDPNHPQQIHLDIMVDDPPTAESQVLALGARQLAADDSDFRVYADPAGHPFCLVSRPAWAAPINP